MASAASSSFRAGKTAEVISVDPCTQGEPCHAVIVELPEYGLTVPICTDQLSGWKTRGPLKFRA